ncbi:MAG: YceI family protein [Gemmatimonadaceae bacterium]
MMFNRQYGVGLIIPAVIGAIAIANFSSNTAAAALAGLHLTVAPSGNEARYRIREQLVRMDLPNDAIGKTTEIAGGIGIGADGKIIPAESKFVVGVGSLKSDRDMRDGYVRRRVLQGDQFPTVEFHPTEFRGLPKTLPTSGAHTFDVIGNLTVKGVTKPTTWHVTAEQKNGQVTGNASTLFTFSDFNIDQPRVPVLLSVQDTIRLEYDFTLVERK